MSNSNSQINLEKYKQLKQQPFYKKPVKPVSCNGLSKLRRWRYNNYNSESSSDDESNAIISVDSNNTVLNTQPCGDIITTITLNKRHINILQDITSSKYPKIFLSHAWGKDDHNRDNHLRVYQLNNLLKRRKCLTWFDETDLEGGIVQSMTSGIDWADLVIVCITRSYINKCKKQGNDNCKLEFEYSINRKSALRIIPLVMEDSCKNQSTWEGPVGACCGQLLYIDCCWEIDNSIADTIYKRIVKKIQSIPKQNNDN